MLLTNSGPKVSFFYLIKRVCCYLLLFYLVGILSPWASQKIRYVANFQIQDVMRFETFDSKRTDDVKKLTYKFEL